MSELVDKSEVLDIWNNYWITDMTALDAEDQLRELATVEVKSAPQLSENQQIVLERLKEMMVSFDLCNAIHRLERAEDWGYSKEPYDIAYESLNDKQRRQVVQEACQWAQGQEE